MRAYYRILQETYKFLIGSCQALIRFLQETCKFLIRSYNIFIDFHQESCVKDLVSSIYLKITEMDKETYKLLIRFYSIPTIQLFTRILLDLKLERLL